MVRALRSVGTLNVILLTDRSMKPAAQRTVKTLCVAVKTPALLAGGGGRLGTGEPTVSVTCHCTQWRTSWSTLPKPDPGTGSTGPETYQHTMFGLRPGNSSCLNLQSSPGSSTSNNSFSFMALEKHNFTHNTVGVFSSYYCR